MILYIFFKQLFYPSTKEKALHLTQMNNEINKICEYMRSKPNEAIKEYNFFYK